MLNRYTTGPRMNVLQNITETPPNVKLALVPRGVLLSWLWVEGRI
jgi:hypothetical protein